MPSHGHDVSKAPVEQNQMHDASTAADKGGKPMHSAAAVLPDLDMVVDDVLGALSAKLRAKGSRTQILPLLPLDEAIQVATGLASTLAKKLESSHSLEVALEFSINFAVKLALSLAGVNPDGAGTAGTSTTNDHTSMPAATTTTTRRAPQVPSQMPPSAGNHQPVPRQDDMRPDPNYKDRAYVCHGPFGSDGHQNWRCGGGYCIDGKGRCNGYANCADRSDEADCEKKQGASTTSAASTASTTSASMSTTTSLTTTSVATTSATTSILPPTTTTPAPLACEDDDAGISHWASRHAISGIVQCSQTKPATRSLLCDIREARQFCRRTCNECSPARASKKSSAHTTTIFATAAASHAEKMPTHTTTYIPATNYYPFTTSSPYPPGQYPSYTGYGNIDQYPDQEGIYPNSQQYPGYANYAVRAQQKLTKQQHDNLKPHTTEKKEAAMPQLKEQDQSLPLPTISLEEVKQMRELLMTGVAAGVKKLNESLARDEEADAAASQL
eukprot:gnl/TRDRNA2_/TRDRNA2_122660_c1_seq1.p1 gnl/TRDRNA2_/TRDRNA2_122660_c1~~gnl/TRDRNA2_/TRDRNA2_122660_c1_seq1.p1  ORF type:complete len:543 (+),score=85.60 gnl/TRDRNA2_/TRDRNA2_122660_c1_seq1:134-1630(+)